MCQSHSDLYCKHIFFSRTISCVQIVSYESQLAFLKCLTNSVCLEMNAASATQNGPPPASHPPNYTGRSHRTSHTVSSMLTPFSWRRTYIGSPYQLHGLITEAGQPFALPSIFSLHYNQNTVLKLYICSPRSEGFLHKKAQPLSRG